MDTFTYSPEEARRLRRMRSLQVSIPLAFGVCVLLIGTYIVVPGIPISDYLSTCLMTVAIAAVIGFVQIRAAAKSAASLSITIDSDHITKTQLRSSDVTILRSEVREIVEFPEQGLRIVSTIPTEAIFVPKELAGYDQIKTVLGSWCLFTTDTRRIPLALLAIVGVAILFGALIINRSTRVYGLALYGAGFVVVCIWSAVQTIRKYLSRRDSSQI